MSYDRNRQFEGLIIISVTVENGNSDIDKIAS